MHAEHQIKHKMNVKTKTDKNECDEIRSDEKGKVTQPKNRHTVCSRQIFEQI